MTLVLKDVCEFIVDCPHSTAPDEGRGYPIIRTPNVGRGYLILDGVQRVSESAYNQRNIRAVPKNGDLILAREAPAGNVAIIDTEEKVCLGQRTVLLRPDTAKVDPWFLNYYLNAPDQRHALLKNANGATVGHVNMPIIRNLPINLPSAKTQKRIAGVLHSYDKLIENNRKQIKLLEEAAQRLYKEWFIDFKFPGHEVVSIDSETHLPKGWKKGTLSEIVEFRRGKTITQADTAEGNVPVVAGGLGPAYYHNEFNACGPVVTVSGSGANAGFTRLYTENIWASDCSYVDSNMTKVLPFVYESVINVGRGFKHLQRGSAQPHVYPSHINSMELNLPDGLLIDKYCQLINPLIEIIKQLSQSIRAAEEARDRLLPKLMSGEIEVN